MYSSETTQCSDADDYVSPRNERRAGGSHVDDAAEHVTPHAFAAHDTNGHGQEPPMVSEHATTYGDPTVDPGDEVPFSVELCKIKNLPGLYIVDIRRMRGNVWSYKYLYHVILDTLDLSAKGGYISVAQPPPPPPPPTPGL